MPNRVASIGIDSIFATISYLIAMVVFTTAPLFYGSVDEFWILIWCSALSFSLAIAPTDGLSSKQAKLLIPPAAAATLVFIVVAIQLTIDMPPILRDSGWQIAEQILGTPPGKLASVNREGPWFALGPTFLFLLAFIRSFVLCRREKDAWRLLAMLAGAGTLYAIGSITLYILFPSANFGRSSVAYAHNLTGPFVNRNTAAVFWGSAALVLQVLLFHIGSEQFRGVASYAAFRHRLSDNAPRSLFLTAAALMICLSAMVMTASRSVVLIEAVLSIFATVVWLRRYMSARGAVLIGAPIAIVLMGLFLESSGDRIALRIDQGGLFDRYRLATYQSTLKMIFDHPWLGVGLGNFETAFPSYRSEALGSFGIWDHAHNTLLEIAAELGIPVAVVIAAIWIWGGLRLVRGVENRRKARLYPLAALCVGCLGTLHSLIDFSLQIPGYSIYFAAIMGCGLAQSLSPSSAVDVRQPTGVRLLQRFPLLRLSRRAKDLGGAWLLSRLPGRGVWVGSNMTTGAHSLPAGESLPDHGATIRVFVATPLGAGGKGGIDRIMDELRRQLAASPNSGIKTVFLTTRGQGHIAWSPLYLLVAILRLAFARVFRQVDVLHVNLSSHGSTKRKLILCRVAAFIGVPYVVHLHGSRFRQFCESAKPQQAEAIDAMFKGAAGIVTLGTVWKRFIADRCSDATSRISIIPNASRAPRITVSQEQTPVTILFLGHVGPRKGVPDLVRALARLKSLPHWEAIIAGNGDLDTIRSLVGTLGLDKQVRLTGWVGTQDVDRLLSAASILVLPSYDENLPMSVIEGMAYGSAIVTTPVGAVEDIIANDVTGLLVAPGDVEGLAAALERLVLDASLRCRLGEAAAAFHRANLDMDLYMRRVSSLWRTVAAEHRS